MDTDVSDLTKLSVNLVPRALVALQLAAQTTGNSQTDTVNRALQIYAYLVSERAQGRHVLTSPSVGPVGLCVAAVCGKVEELKLV
jgi:hypothetical protein